MTAPDPNCCPLCGGTGETEVYGDPDNLAPCACTIPDDTEDDDIGDGGGSQPIRPIVPPPTNTDGGTHGEKSPIQAKDLADALEKTI